MWAFGINWHLSLLSVICLLFTFESSPLKPISQVNWSLVGSIYGRSSLKCAHFVLIHLPNMALHRQFLFLIGQFFQNLILWDRLAKLTETGQEASLECPLWRLLILSWSVNKHGHHRQFLFLISKRSSPLKLPSQMNRSLVGSIYMYGRLCIKFPQSRMKDWLLLHKIYMLHIHCSFSFRGPQERLASLC